MELPQLEETVQILPKKTLLHQKLVFILKSALTLKFVIGKGIFGSVTNQHFDFNLWGHWLLHLPKEESGKVTPRSTIPSPNWTSA